MSSPAPPSPAPEAPHPDLGLASACLSGDPGALAELERILGHAELRKALGRFESGGVSTDDVLQRVREKLLLGAPDAPPKLGQYTGRGPLPAWLRAVAVRTGLDMAKRAPPSATALEDAPELAFVGPDPDWLYLRRHHARQAHEALRAAVEALPARDLNVLRLHFLDGLNIDAIGKAYGVHRATVARWIAGARTSLLRGTRERLARELQLSPERAASLLRALRSSFHLSLATWLEQKGA